jgi:CIC family chloride channel protein
MADSTKSPDSQAEKPPVLPRVAPKPFAAEVPTRSSIIDSRVLVISLMAVGVAVAAEVMSHVFFRMIGFFTNLSFYGRLSTEFVSPAHSHLGLWVIPIPVVGGLIVGAMARWGSKAIRGHGTPEAIEGVLINESRVAPRIVILKPLSAAISIGTGGPFGAEGPIIFTGSAIGSLAGQIFSTTAQERKALLAAGAAAGMTATFGSPVASVLMALELLLYEYRPRSLIPVAVASVATEAVRIKVMGTAPIFPMPELTTLTAFALVAYTAIGALAGLASVIATRAAYWCEDVFTWTRIHWMWWPAIGGFAVGLIGYFSPRTLGVGYDNISEILSGRLATDLLIVFCILKTVSWGIALGSGTSGSTMAPLFNIGGALGAVGGVAVAHIFPEAGIDPRMAAVVGMASIFAGASWAVLTSVVFAFEATHQSLDLLPMLGGCTAAYLVSVLLMPHSIMTEKIARRGVHVPLEFSADPLEEILVCDVASKEPVTLSADATFQEVTDWLTSDKPGSQYNGFPVLDAEGHLCGVLTRRDFFDQEHPGDTRLADLIQGRAAAIYDDCTVREAADHMVRHEIGHLPVMRRGAPGKVVGMMTRSDVLSAYRRRLRASKIEPAQIRFLRRRKKQAEGK